MKTKSKQLVRKFKLVTYDKNMFNWDKFLKCMNLKSSNSLISYYVHKIAVQNY